MVVELRDRANRGFLETEGAATLRVAQDVEVLKAAATVREYVLPRQSGVLAGDLVLRSGCIGLGREIRATLDRFVEVDTAQVLGVWLETGINTTGGLYNNMGVYVFRNGERDGGTVSFVAEPFGFQGGCAQSAQVRGTFCFFAHAFNIESVRGSIANHLLGEIFQSGEVAKSAGREGAQVSHFLAVARKES